MSLVDDIATFLATTASTAFSVFSGTTGNLGKQLFLDAVHPNTVTVLYETEGLANSYVFSTATGSASVAFERPGLQILARSTHYATARANADTAYRILDGLTMRTLPTTSAGTLYQDITAVAPPFSIGRDENERWIVSTNYLVRKKVG